MLIARGLGCTLAGRPLLVDAQVELAGGEILAVLGPNGAGKSTLLRLLAREQPPTSGSIDLNGRPLADWDPNALARWRAVLPQSDSLRFAFQARAVVALGRYPWGEYAGRYAEGIVNEALRAAGVAHLAARPYTQLSAGERARVQLARVLAQIWEPRSDGARYLFLDEPTASLDISHQHDVLSTLRQIAQTGVGILLVLHDLNLALEYSDRAVLMKQGRIVADGVTRDVLTAARVAEVFDVEVDLLPRGPDRAPWIAPRPRRSPAA